MAHPSDPPPASQLCAAVRELFQRHAPHKAEEISARWQQSWAHNPELRKAIQDETIAELETRVGP